MTQYASHSKARTLLIGHQVTSAFCIQLKMKYLTFHFKFALPGGKFQIDLHTEHK